MFHHSRLNTEFTWPPLVNFLEPEEPSIYGYGYAPRYISELVANQRNSEQENFHTCTVIDKEKKRNPFNL